MDQLQALDTMFLGLEDENVHANIGGVSVLDGPPPSIAELRAQAAGMLGYVPRYRQRLQPMPRGLGRPLWVDDEQFDLTEHLYETDLGSEVNDEQLRDHFAASMATHLDREKPLWKIQIVRNLPEDRWAILWTVHHAMVDGIAATDLMPLLLSFDPNATTPAEPQNWEPAGPAPLKAAAKALGGPAGPLKPLRDIGRGLARPKQAAGAIGRAARGLLPVGRSLVMPKGSPLNGPIGPDRIWQTTQLDLARIKLVGTLYGATVNDVVLAAVTEGLREHLAEMKVETKGYRPRTMVPVSVRSEDERGVADNRVSAVFVDLPVDIEDPEERLGDVRRQMERIKERGGESTAKLLGEAAGWLPDSVFMAGERTVLRLADFSRLFNTITTNVPGPQMPLYCLGRRMRTLRPFVMLSKDQRITTAVLSYDGGVYFGVTGDKESVPDLSAFCRGVDRALDELLASRTAGGRHLRLVA
jgi:WS/DGAT/MGAT family acyltransferase